MTTETPAPETLPAAPAPVAGPAWAVGRRKAATARVRIAPGEGKLSINGRTLDAYFLDLRDRATAVQPLKSSGAETRYDIVVSVQGGGSTGQAGAVCLAIARAIGKSEPHLRPMLRKEGLVTRDARVKERKKYGRRGARRGFQFSKR
jgi:small subunit ribosomal protein S9